MEGKITTQREYDDVRVRVEQLINEATQKGMIEPEMDNEYTREIAQLSKMMADYEDNSLGLQTLRIKKSFGSKH